MTSDSEIYDTLGQILFRIAPQESYKILSTIKLSPESDVCHVIYDYIDQHHNKYWFIPKSTDDNWLIMDAIISLRKFYLKNNLNNGQPIWSTAHMSLVLATGKFDIEFDYTEDDDDD